MLPKRNDLALVDWLLLVTSLAGQQSALRIRIWRSLKAMGAVPLRDGVYVVPDTPTAVRAFEETRGEVTGAGGDAYVLPLSNLGADDETAFVALFDRSEDYAQFAVSIDQFTSSLPDRTETEARRVLRQLRRDLAGIEAIDFFPGAALREATAGLREAEAALTRMFSPEEPSAIRAEIERQHRSAFRGRSWATRTRLWVDRVASAWLIRRFIDPDARFLWLQHPSDCPVDAVGFDFDGAQFTHVDDHVTFEVLIASFGLLGDAALARLATMVHMLDVGGERVPEAFGFEAMLTGARERCNDDDSLLAHVSPLLDDLYAAFTQRPSKTPAEVP